MTIKVGDPIDPDYVLQGMGISIGHEYDVLMIHEKTASYMEIPAFNRIYMENLKYDSMISENTAHAKTNMNYSHGHHGYEVTDRSRLAQFTATLTQTGMTCGYLYMHASSSDKTETDLSLSDFVIPSSYSRGHYSYTGGVIRKTTTSTATRNDTIRIDRDELHPIDLLNIDEVEIDFTSSVSGSVSAYVTYSSVDPTDDDETTGTRTDLVSVDGDTSFATTRITKSFSIPHSGRKNDSDLDVLFSFPGAPAQGSTITIHSIKLIKYSDADFNDSRFTKTYSTDGGTTWLPFRNGDFKRFSSTNEIRLRASYGSRPAKPRFDDSVVCGNIL